MADPLADFLSGDPQRIWQASWDIIGTRDKNVLEHLRLALPAIERATATIELGGMIFSNRDALVHALDKVQNYAHGNAGATTTGVSSPSTRRGKRTAVT